MKNKIMALGLFAVAAAALVGCGGSAFDSPAFGSDGHVRGVNLLSYGDRIDFLGATSSVPGGSNLAFGAASDYSEYNNNDTFFNFRNPTAGNVAGTTFTPTLGSYSTVYGVKTATGYDAFRVDDNAGGVNTDQVKIRLVHGFAGETPVDIYVTNDTPGALGDGSRKADDIRYTNTQPIFLDSPVSGTRTVYVTVTDAHDPTIVLLPATAATFTSGKAYSAIVYRASDGSTALATFDEHVD
jgi:hypothetical protein